MARGGINNGQDFRLLSYGFSNWVLSDFFSIPRQDDDWWMTFAEHQHRDPRGSNFRLRIPINDKVKDGAASDQVRMARRLRLLF